MRNRAGLVRRAASRRHRSRAQGLVEFALVLPVILLILLVTIDFGRALYGWVVLQNSARIAANFAGLNADGFRDNNANVKARYAAQITADLQAANCTSFGSGGGSGTPPDPTFIDGPDVPDPAGPVDTAYDVGDIARVSLTCTFHPITPIISAIIGNNFQLGASSEFKIRTGTVTGLANPTEIPPPATPTPVPTATPAPTATPTGTACPAPAIAFKGVSGTNTTPPDGNSPLVVVFTDQSTFNVNCPITAWKWTFSDGQQSTQQNPTLTFTKSGNGTTHVDATLTVTYSGGTPSLAKNNYITVR